jgi:DNA (cytosine-5)-methyltransferase 1
MRKALDRNIIGAVDMFCGVGGLTHGLRRAGIDVKFGINIDARCRFPFEENNKTRFSQKSVADVTPKEIKSAWGEAPFKPLASCAPCRPFSTYSNGADPSADKRWPLLLEFARLIRKSKPDFVTMENVPKLQSQDIFEQFIAILKEAKYHVSHAVVNCANYGVPQSRHRLVLLASRHGEVRLIPPRSTANEYITVRQAIGGLPSLKAGEHSPDDPLHQSCELSPINLARIQASIPGGTWRDWPKKLISDCHARGTGGKYVSVYGRMIWDEPSPTMTTQYYGFGNGRFGHPEQDHGISLREGAILQSFPKNYKFVPPGEPVYNKIVGRLIGNAVPVKLGEAIGRSFIAHAAEIQGVR